MAAVWAKQQQAAPPVMHSRNLNPYVASAFQEWLSVQQNVLPLVPKECAVWAAAPSSLAACSSFGMSGVNAHALMSSPSTNDVLEKIETTWQRQHRWPYPPFHHMLFVSSFNTFNHTLR